MAKNRPIRESQARPGEGTGANPGREGSTDEREQIERAQQGDADAFEALLRSYQRRVFSVIGSVVRQPAETEDIAQQVFLKVYLGLGRFDFRSAFSTWLYRIVVNECYDHLRRQRALKSAPPGGIRMGDLAELDRWASVGRPGAEIDIARRLELREVVEQLLGRLPAGDRLLLILKEVEGFTTEEIAHFVGRKESTVKVRLFRARKRLVEIHRRILERHRRKEV
jgi:RNA polymerase sigma-70 factor (ECF subfamily)